MKHKKCPLCNSNIFTKTLFKKNNVFISVGKIDNVPDEQSNFGEIELIQCKKCGYIFNDAFNLEKMNSEYNSNNYVLKKIVSPEMSKNLNNLKEEILKHTTSESVVVEIGCGDGSLACAIVQRVKHVYTVDPSIESINITNIGNITHINDYYSFDKVSSIIGTKVDIIILRHLLEHISKPFEFLNEINSLLKDNGIIYIEVPNVEEIIKSGRFYDVFHDHFGYFSQEVLVNYFARLGLSLKQTANLFNEQHLGLFFIKNNKKVGLSKSVKLYSNSITTKFLKNVKEINKAISQKDNVAIYGAGAHGNSLLNCIDSENKAKIKVCFDKDNNKQHKYLQSSNIEIKEPSSKILRNIDLIIMASSLYEQEIINQLLLIGYNGKILKTAELNKLNNFEF